MSKRGEYIYGTDGHEGHWLTGEELVRCGNCRYASAGEAVIGGNWKLGSCHNPRFRGSIHAANVRADDFCKWGERKADE